MVFSTNCFFRLRIQFLLAFQFYFRTTDVTGVCALPAGTEMCMPGDNVEMTIELIHPIAMEQGLTFAIREGGRTVGSGRVATIIE